MQNSLRSGGLHRREDHKGRRSCSNSPVLLVESASQQAASPPHSPPAQLNTNRSDKHTQRKHVFAVPSKPIASTGVRVTNVICENAYQRLRTSPWSWPKSVVTFRCASSSCTRESRIHSRYKGRASAALLRNPDANRKHNHKSIA